MHSLTDEIANAYYCILVCAWLRINWKNGKKNTERFDWTAALVKKNLFHLCFLFNTWLPFNCIYIFPAHSCYSTEIRKTSSPYLITLQTSFNGSKDNKYRFVKQHFISGQDTARFPFLSQGNWNITFLSLWVCESFHLQSLVAFENMKK